MALGTYDREERKKLAYNANGTTSEEKDDRSAQGNVSRQEPVAAPIQPTQVAPAPQVQNVGTVNVPQVNASAQPKQEQSNDELTQQNGGATPPQNAVTNQGPQSNVIPGGEIKNNQGEVNQKTGTSSESQVGPQNAIPPLNAPVREFGGYNFSTVTSSGKALTDSDMGAYFDMLKRKSEETGASIEDLDKIAGNLLVGKIPSAEQSNQEDAPAVESVPENGNNTTNNGAANTTTGNGASSTSGASSSKPKVTVMPPAAKPAASNATAPTSEEQQYYDNWKDFSLEQLKDMLPANSGIPAKKAALERLISEKGGSVPAAQASPDAPRYTQRQQSRRDAAARKMGDKSLYNGNVDLLNRPSVDAKTMQAAGYTDIPDGSHASVYSMQNGFNDKSRGGKVREILYTPIMADGTVLSKKEVDDYIAGLGKKGDIVELDKPENGGRGLVIAADVTGDPGPELHRLQEDYYSTPEDYAARDKAAREDITSAYGGGNLDPLHVKSVKRADMEKAGWNGPFDGDEVSVYPLEQTIIDSAGNRHTVLISPITRDGEIMTQQEFEDYVEGLQGSEDIMADDKSDKAVIIKYDATKGEADALHEKLRDVSPAEEDAAPPPSTFEVERTNDVHQSLSDDLDRATEAVDRQSELIRQFAGDPTSGRGALALKLYQDKLKEEGYDEESEKRLEKRRRTAGIIANIGDVLQGFANLAGTWFGADSQKLTSLSAAARAGEDKVDAKRKDRKDELRKSYEKAITKIGDDMQAELKRLERVMERANDRLRNYEVATGKEAQRASNREKQREQDYENTRKRMTLQQKYKEKNARQAQEFKKEMEQIKKENKIATIAFSAEKQKEVKQTPGARSKSGKKKGGGKGSSGPASRK